MRRTLPIIRHCASMFEAFLPAVGVKIEAAVEVHRRMNILLDWPYTWLVK